MFDGSIKLIRFVVILMLKLIIVVCFFLNILMSFGRNMMFKKEELIIIKFI